MFPSGPKSFKFASVCLFTGVITEGERDQENLNKYKSRSYQHLDFDHCGDDTDQPCECEKCAQCAGIRRHDVGLRSGNWIMAPDSSNSPGVTSPVWLGLALCRSLTSKQPRSTQWQCVCRQKMQLTPSPGPGEVTCHHTCHVMSRITPEGHQVCRVTRANCHGKIYRGCVMCVLKIVVVQRTLSSKVNRIFDL